MFITGLFHNRNMNADEKCNFRQAKAEGFAGWYLSQCVPTLLFSTRPVNLHGPRVTNGNQSSTGPKISSFASRFCIGMQILLIVIRGDKEVMILTPSLFSW